MMAKSPINLLIFGLRQIPALSICEGSVSKANETAVHKNSFQKIKKIFRKKYPKLSIELKIISLNSKVETFK